MAGVENPTPEGRVRFSVYFSRDDRVRIFDDEFHWDAALRIVGDFGSRDEKARFAQAICDVLNEAGDRIPKE